MKRKFLTNLILLLFLNLLVKPFWILGIDLTVQNTVGSEAYGFYFSLFSFSILLNILLDLGITHFNTRAVARDPHLLPQFLSGIVVLKLTLAVLYAAVSFGLAWIIGYDRLQLGMLLFLVFNQFLASFILYLRSNLSGLHLFRTDSLVSVIDRVVMIAICGTLLWGNVTEKPFRIEWFVYAQTASYLFTLFLVFILVLGKASWFKPRLNLKEWKSLLRQSIPFATLILLMSFYYRVDSVMLERMLPDGKEQAGIYAQAFRILDVFGMFAFLFAGLLLPIFSRMIRNSQPVEEITRFSFSLLLVPSTILCLVMIWYRTELMDALYVTHARVSSEILAVLMLAFIGMAASYIYGTLLTANGSLGWLNSLAAAALLLNIGLNLVLIPRYQALGSAFASMLTQVLTAVGHWIISKKIFGFVINIRLLIRWIIFLAGTTVICAGIHTLVNSWPAAIALMLVSSLLWSFFAGLIRPAEIHSLLKYREDEPFTSDPEYR